MLGTFTPLGYSVKAVSFLGKHYFHLKICLYFNCVHIFSAVASTEKGTEKKKKKKVLLGHSVRAFGPELAGSNAVGPRCGRLSRWQERVETVQVLTW